MEDFFKKIFLDVHFGEISSLSHSALQRNAATLRKVWAPLSVSHVIDYFSLFLFFFPRSFLVYMVHVTSD